VNLSDEQLGEELLRADLAATTRQSKLARLMVEEGLSIIEAVRRAGLSARNRTPWKAASRPGVVRLVALLREQARRKATLTVTGQIQRFQHLSRAAEDVGELSTAVQAEVQASKLAGLLKDATAPANAPTTQILVITGLPNREPAETRVQQLLDRSRPVEAGVSSVPRPVPQQVDVSFEPGGSNGG
jgi:hypothetical protein